MPVDKLFLRNAGLAKPQASEAMCSRHTGECVTFFHVLWGVHGRPVTRCWAFFTRGLLWRPFKVRCSLVKELYELSQESIKTQREFS